MIKFVFYIKKEMKEALIKTAEELETSVASVIRMAIKAFLETKGM